MIKISRRDPAFLKALLDVCTKVFVVRVARAVVTIESLFEISARSTVHNQRPMLDGVGDIDIQVFDLLQEL